MMLQEAYARCEQITREEAKNFAFGIRLLPPPKRTAMSAIYAFARRIDDISDGDASPPEKLAALAGVRDQIDTLRVGSASPDDAVLVALADVDRRFPIPWDGFDDLVTGCEADARGASYASFEELVQYCRYVAGSIGRLSLAVFGTDDWDRAIVLADALGVALQLTNILRDVREDRLAGRVYLPAEDLERFGCTLDLDRDGRFVDEPERLDALIRYEAGRARTWYERGVRLVPLLDRRSAACTAAMAGIYRRLLERIAADPAESLTMRLSLSRWDKTMVAARSLTGAQR
jgi:squalene synthase HpnD